MCSLRVKKKRFKISQNDIFTTWLTIIWHCEWGFTLIHTICKYVSFFKRWTLANQGFIGSLIPCVKVWKCVVHPHKNWINNLIQGRNGVEKISVVLVVHITSDTCKIQHSINNIWYGQFYTWKETTVLLICEHSSVQPSLNNFLIDQGKVVNKSRYPESISWSKFDQLILIWSVDLNLICCVDLLIPISYDQLIRF